jgi:uncharacterized protein YjiS (DUF1127 family)
MENTMSHALVDCSVIETRPVIAPAAASMWRHIRSTLARWSARRRFRRSIAHLDDRLLADIGFTADDLGVVDRIVRRYVAGGELWTGRQVGL